MLFVALLPRTKGPSGTGALLFAPRINPLGLPFLDDSGKQPRPADDRLTDNHHTGAAHLRYLCECLGGLSVAFFRVFLGL